MIHVWIAGGAVSVRRTARPKPKEGHALLRLIRGGVCNTDIELLRGYYGFRGRPGHEFVAEVIECGDSGWLRKRVVGEINLPCRRCAVCAQGNTRHCPRRTVLGIVKQPGAFAEYFTLPLENLHRVPASVKSDHAVFAEPVAAACEILDQTSVGKGDVAAVLGDGKLGLLVAQVLQAHGVEVHLYGKHASKMAVARAAGIAARPAARLPRQAYSFTIEATGSEQGIHDALRMTAPLGTIVMKSTIASPVTLNTSSVVVNEITLLGSRCGRFEPALKLIRSGKLHLDKMISSTYPLSDAPAAFEHAQQRGVLKVLLSSE